VITIQQGSARRDQHLMLSSITAEGIPSGNAIDIFGRWAEFTAPVVLPDAAGTGLRMYFGGEQTDIANDPFGTTRMITATSSDGGLTWVLDPAHSNFTGTGVANVAGALDASGAPVLAWATIAGVFTHIGFGSATNDNEFESTENCCGWTPAVGYDPPSKSEWTAWRSDEARRNGLFLRHVAGGWSAPQKRWFVPRSTNTEIDGPVPMATQTGGAKRLWTAWCERTNAGCSTVFAMRPVDKRRVVVANVKRAHHIGMTAGVGGRLWVWWSTKNGIYVTRSNAAVTKFAKPRRVEVLDGIRGMWRIDGAGTRSGKLDLLVSYTVGANARLYHQRVNPPK
jgi:hypothetical protein